MLEWGKPAESVSSTEKIAGEEALDPADATAVSWYGRRGIISRMDAAAGREAAPPARRRKEMPPPAERLKVVVGRIARKMCAVGAVAIVGVGVEDWVFL
jgi:hypothetical protein